jgi:hypothetical protein
MIRRALAADTDVFVLLTAGLDRQMQHFLHRRITFVKQMCDQTGVAIQPQGQLRHIVGSDREAVEIIQKLIGQQRI